MATRMSSDGLAKTINADGFSAGGGTTKRTATFTGGDVTISGSGSSVHTYPGYSGKLLSYKRNAVADAAYTVTTSDYLVAFPTLTAARTITLPAASTMTDRVIIIIDESATPMKYKLTLDGSGSELVNGETTWGFYGMIQIYCNGTAWYILDGESLGAEIAPLLNRIVGFAAIPQYYTHVAMPSFTITADATLFIGADANLVIKPI